jgi:hypothetical protein
MPRNIFHDDCYKTIGAKPTGDSISGIFNPEAVLSGNSSAWDVISTSQHTHQVKKKILITDWSLGMRALETQFEFQQFLSALVEDKFEVYLSQSDKIILLDKKNIPSLINAPKEIKFIDNKTAYQRMSQEFNIGRDDLCILDYQKRLDIQNHFFGKYVFQINEHDILLSDQKYIELSFLMQLTEEEQKKILQTSPVVSLMIRKKSQIVGEYAEPIKPKPFADQYKHLIKLSNWLHTNQKINLRLFCDKREKKLQKHTALVNNLRKIKGLKKFSIATRETIHSHCIPKKFSHQKTEERNWLLAKDIFSSVKNLSLLEKIVFEGHSISGSFKLDKAPPSFTTIQFSGNCTLKNETIHSIQQACQHNQIKKIVISGSTDSQNVEDYYFPASKFVKHLKLNGSAFHTFINIKNKNKDKKIELPHLSYLSIDLFDQSYDSQESLDRLATLAPNLIALDIIFTPNNKIPFKLTSHQNKHTDSDQNTSTVPLSQLKFLSMRIKNSTDKKKISPFIKQIKSSLPPMPNLKFLLIWKCQKYRSIESMRNTLYNVKSTLRERVGHDEDIFGDDIPSLSDNPSMFCRTKDVYQWRRPTRRNDQDVYQWIKPTQDQSVDRALPNDPTDQRLEKTEKIGQAIHVAQHVNVLPRINIYTRVQDGEREITYLRPEYKQGCLKQIKATVTEVDNLAAHAKTLHQRPPKKQANYALYLTYAEYTFQQGPLSKLFNGKPYSPVIQYTAKDKIDFYMEQNSSLDIKKLELYTDSITQRTYIVSPKKGTVNTLQVHKFLDQPIPHNSDIEKLQKLVEAYKQTLVNNKKKKIKNKPLWQCRYTLETGDGRCQTFVGGFFYWLSITLPKHHPWTVQNNHGVYSHPNLYIACNHQHTWLEAKDKNTGRHYSFDLGGRVIQEEYVPSRLDTLLQLDENKEDEEKEEKEDEEKEDDTSLLHPGTRKPIKSPHPVSSPLEQALSKLDNIDQKKWFCQMCLDVLQSRLPKPVCQLLTQHLHQLPDQHTQDERCKQPLDQNNNLLQAFKKELGRQTAIQTVKTSKEIKKYAAQLIKIPSEPSNLHRLIHLLNKENVSDCIELIRQESIEAKVPLYFINDPKQLNEGNHSYLHIQQPQGNQDKPSPCQIKAPPGGGLQRFIQENEKSDQAPIIMIDWRNFSNWSDYTGLLNVDDNTRKINGRSLPNHFRIISVVDSSPQCQAFLDDDSFTSRHHIKHQLETSPDIYQPLRNSMHQNKQEEKEEPQDDAMKIDLFYSHAFKRFLLGSTTYDSKGNLIFEKGALIKGIENDKTHFILDHAPQALPQFKQFIREIQLTGKIQYLNYSLNCPKNIKFSYTHTPLEQYSEQVESMFIGTVEQTEKCDITHYVSQTNFEQLFYNKTVESDKLKVYPGWIELAKNQTLTLYIHRTLNQSHYHRLLSACKKYHVILKLYFSEKVDHTILSNCFKNKPVNKLKHVQPEQRSHQTDQSIIFSDNPFATACKIKENKKGTWMIPITDMKATELLYEIKHEKKEYGITFSCQDSSIIRGLNDGKHVIVYGDPSDANIDHMWSLLLSKPYLWRGKEKQNFEGKLTLITRRKAVLEAFSHAQDWKDTDEKEEEKEESTVQENNGSQSNPQPLEDNPTDPLLGNQRISISPLSDRQERKDDSDSTQGDVAAIFFNNRKQTVLKALEEGPAVIIEGSTGTGKSKFMDQLGLEDALQVYGLPEAEKWAQDKSNKNKILHIDEYNIKNSNFYQFENLFSDHPSIVIKGKYYRLDQHHKIIFTGNPTKTYGGTRYDPGLFEKHPVKKIIFDSIPFDVFRDKIEERLAEYSSTFINVLSALYEEHADQFTPRDFFMLASLYRLHEKSVEKHIRQENMDEDSSFTLTDSRKKICDKIDYLFDLHTLRHQLKNKQDSIATGGLNGLVITGEPGTGKSRLLKWYFSQKGYYQIELRDQHNHTDHKGYYFLDGDTDPQDVQSTLQRAYANGQPVVIDEFANSPEKMYEDTLNALLSSVDLNNTPSQQPGFMVIFLRNGTDLPGRSTLSPAIEARCIMVDIDPYSPEECWQIFSKDQQIDLSRHKKEEWINLFKWYFKDSQRITYTRPTFRRLQTLMRTNQDWLSFSLFSWFKNKKKAPTNLSLANNESSENLVNDSDAQLSKTAHQNVPAYLASSVLFGFFTFSIAGVPIGVIGSTIITAATGLCYVYAAYREYKKSNIVPDHRASRYLHAASSTLAPLGATFLLIIASNGLFGALSLPTTAAQSALTSWFVCVFTLSTLSACLQTKQKTTQGKAKILTPHILQLFGMLFLAVGHPVFNCLSQGKYALYSLQICMAALSALTSLVSLTAALYPRHTQNHTSAPKTFAN